MADAPRAPAFRRRDHEPFAFGAIWEPAAGEIPEGYCLLTTSPNELMTPIHDRTPVIVQRVALRCWLAPEPLSEADYAAITSPFPSENLEAFPISPLVNNTRNEGPQLLERAAT